MYLPLDITFIKMLCKFYYRYKVRVIKILIISYYKKCSKNYENINSYYISIVKFSILIEVTSSVEYILLERGE